MTGTRGTPQGRGPLTPASAMRIAAIGLAAVILMGVLVTRLWFLQVIGGQAYANQADQNRVRTIDLPAQRGTITDRNGRVLATVRDGWNLVARPLELRNPRRQTIIRRLAAVVGKEPRPMLAELARGEKNTPYESVVLVKDVPLGLRVAFAEHQRDFPGVTLERSFVRTYPDGTTAAHVLGTVGPIFAEDFERYRDQGYVGNEIVGKSGVEAQYESYLKGAKGRQVVEVDATGRPVGGGVYDTQAPTPGNTLVLSIDMKTQKALEDQLRFRVDSSSAPGAAGVALDPRTGEVLAMASYPTFEPEAYARSRVKLIQAYNRDNRGQPLSPRFMQAYPPGSTFKPVTLSGALELPLTDDEQRPLTPQSTMLSDSCIELYPGQPLCNYEKEYQGTLTLPQALEMSSDTIFYKLGNKFYYADRNRGVEYQQQWAHKFSMGKQTGLDLPGEDAGVVPTAAWKKEQDFYDNRTKTWLPGDNINMAIGQGYMEATPLQMAVAFGAIANGGKVVTPTLAERVQTPAGSLVRQFAGSRPPQDIGLSPSTLRVLHDGLKLATGGPNGTATAIFGQVDATAVQVAGKTGTAESNRQGLDHSWFVGYAPADNPRIVVAVMVEYGGTGASAAAPAVCNTMAAYLKYDPKLCGVSRAKVD